MDLMLFFIKGILGKCLTYYLLLNTNYLLTESEVMLGYLPA